MAEGGAAAVESAEKRVKTGDDCAVDAPCADSAAHSACDAAGDCGDATAAAAAAEGGAPHDDTAATFAEGAAADAPRRFPKRKMAFLLGFNGAEYQGMQFNPKAKTVEAELLVALHRAGCIGDANAGSLVKVDFARSGRTDKGVHAAGMIISLKVEMRRPDFVEEINKHLPADVRVFAQRRVTNGFNARLTCTSRRYEYLMPVKAFAPRKDKEARSAWKFTAETKALIDRVLAMYVGSHKFHNFTAGVPAFSTQAQRFIMAFECSEPFAVHGLEVVRLCVTGQSFLLHQIRKMVAMLLTVTAGYAPPEIIEAAFALPKMNLPRAPGLGLILDKCFYTSYEAKFGSQYGSIEFEDHREAIDAFKRDNIYKYIGFKERAEGVMERWLSEALDVFFADFSESLAEFERVRPEYEARREHQMRRHAERSEERARARSDRKRDKGGARKASGGDGDGDGGNQSDGSGGSQSDGGLAVNHGDS